jgi:hypothetical protein
MDLHGDEKLPFNFLSGSEGVPRWQDGPRLRDLQSGFLKALMEVCVWGCVGVVRITGPMYTHHVLLAGQPRHARRRQVRHQRALRCQPLGRFQGTLSIAVMLPYSLSMHCP